ncbi:MAG: hypothetical protein N2Z74_10390, partial [Syntrophales bacterium]|nr:hypothetical protein [Syntrophales bacterium]
DKEIKQHLKDFTRAQAGLLREMLHPKLNEKTLQKVLEHRIKKYEEKRSSHGHLLDVLNAIERRLRTEGRQAMNAYVAALLDAFALLQWEKKRKGGPS